MRIFRVIAILMLIAWCILIFSLSAQDAASSKETSGKVTEKVISIVYPEFSEYDSEKQDEIIHSVSFYTRKFAHFTIFAVLGVLAILSVITYKKPNFTFKVLISAAFCVIYAISDEFHQAFVSGRSGEIRDVIIDISGSLLAVGLTALIFKFSKILRRFIGENNA